MAIRTSQTVTRTGMAGLAILLLSGCASMSREHGFSDVAGLAASRTGIEARWAKSDSARAALDAEISRLLAMPLEADTAAHIAVLGNPELRASFAGLGIAEADLVQASRMRNPGFSLTQLNGGGETSTERVITLDLLGLLTLPVSARIERNHFEQRKLRVADEIVAVASQARRAFVNAVAARQTVTYLEQARDAIEASVELAERMSRVGNVSQLDLLREKAFFGQVRTELMRAQQHAVSAREALVRALGVTNPARIHLPDSLPKPPNERRQIREAEELALQTRLDLAAGRREIASLASSLGLTRATRFINVLEVGYLNETESRGSDKTGYEISFEIPLFDWGGAKVAKAEAIYMQAVDQLAAAVINARSEVREAHAAYESAHDVAVYYRDEIVPLRRKISEENVLRYNGMLIGPFELLIDAHEQISTEVAFVEAVRDFWLADIDLEHAMGGRTNNQAASVAP